MTFFISLHFTFYNICYFITFDISCNLKFHIIWRFMSFGVSCHLVFHVIWLFMSFGVSCHLAFHVILHFAILVIIVTKVLNGINAKVVIEDRCVFKKWLPLDSHRAVLLQELLRS